MLSSVEVLANARRSLRRAVKLEADVIARSWESPRRHRITDLSAGGMRLAAGTRLAEDEHVIVCFTPPGDWTLDELQLWARVVRSEPRAGGRAAAMGLEILDLARGAERELERVLSGRPPPIPRRARARREHVWIDMLVTYTEDLGDRVNTIEVSEVLRAVEEAELEPAALSDLLTGGAAPYVWRHAA